MNMGKEKVVIFFLFIFGMVYFVFSQSSSLYEISGYALDSEGNPVSGTVTGIIVENQKINITSITGGRWKLNFSEISGNASFTLGIRVNTTNQTGYFYIKKFGIQELQFQATCKDQTWHLSGLVLYPERNVSGSIKVVLGNKIATGSVINGRFDLSITSCLIPGELYNLELEVVSGGLTGYYSTKVIGK